MTTFWNIANMRNNQNEMPSDFEEKMDWYEISKDPRIDVRFIDKHLNKLNWYLVSKNSSITPELIEKYPNYPWNWRGIFENPNISTEFIDKYFLDWYVLYF